MKRMIGLTCVLTVALLWMPVLSAQDTLESVEKAVTENFNKLSSVSGAFDLQAQVKIKPDQPTPMKAVGGGTIDYAKKGDVTQYRGYAWAGLTPAFRMAQAQGLFDGKQAYYDLLVPLANLNESGTASPSDLIVPGGKALFDAMKAHFGDLAVAPSEKIGDKDCYVITGTLRDKIKNVPIDKVRLYLAKDCGVPMRIIVIDDTGNEAGVIQMAGVNINGGVPDSAFMHTPLTPSGAPAPKADEAKAPAAKPDEAKPAEAKPAAAKPTAAAPAAKSAK